MKPTKHLEVDVTTRGLRITAQSHQGDDFGGPACPYVFIASNGFWLASVNEPESIGPEDDDSGRGTIQGGLYVRGDQPGTDTKLLDIPSREWLERCLFAIREYNAHFGTGEPAPRPLVTRKPVSYSDAWITEWDLLPDA